MTTWTKLNWDKTKNISSDDIIVIGEYRFEYRGCWIKLEDEGSDETKMAIQDLLGCNWKNIIYNNFGDLISSSESDFLFTPTFNSNAGNIEFIDFLMREFYDEDKDEDEYEYEDDEDEEEKDEDETIWTKYNFKECKELKEDDIIKFDSYCIYRVRESFLNFPTDQNITILKKVYGDSYIEELELLYGYTAGSGNWPVCIPGDYKALTRVMKNIFQCLYYGHNKPSIRKELYSIPPVDHIITSEGFCVNLNDEPKLTDSRVKISKISDVLTLDKIKLL